MFFAHGFLFQEKPYVMLKHDTNLTGNARYEGFCIDLLKDVANLVGFQYTIEIVKDGKYGVEDPDTKEWNGIVRELIDGVSGPVSSFSSLSWKFACRMSLSQLLLDTIPLSISIYIFYTASPSIHISHTSHSPSFSNDKREKLVREKEKEEERMEKTGEWERGSNKKYIVFLDLVVSRSIIPRHVTLMPLPSWDIAYRLSVSSSVWALMPVHRPTTLPHIFGYTYSPWPL